MAAIVIAIILVIGSIILWLVLQRRRTEIEKKHKDLIREADEVLDDAEKERKRVNEDLENESKENIRRRFFDAFRRKPGSGK